MVGVCCAMQEFASLVIALVNPVAVIVALAQPPQGLRVTGSRANGEVLHHTTGEIAVIFFRLK